MPFPAYQRQTTKSRVQAMLKQFDHSINLYFFITMLIVMSENIICFGKYHKMIMVFEKILLYIFHFLK